ncbi:MAG: hypothetical protein AAB225_06915 [Acidobacteriota bacterium]
MKKIAIVLCLLCAVAFAQSSGNFSATAVPATCSIGAGGALGGGTGIYLWSSNISTSNGKGVTLKITPSMVTGLFTRTKIDTSIPTASADVGIQVCVKVDGSGVGILPTDCVVYDQRFQQVSSNLFSQIAACNTIVCTTDANCPATATCFNPNRIAGGGVCVAPTAETCTVPADCDVAGQICLGGFCNAVVGVANPLCDFELILSTLSAHSFDFVVPVGWGKPHTVTATWSVIGTGPTGNSSVDACVGPGILTVEQVKVFNNSGGLITIP